MEELLFSAEKAALCLKGTKIVYLYIVIAILKL